jgi:cytochrome c5
MSAKRNLLSLSFSASLLALTGWCVVAGCESEKAAAPAGSAAEAAPSTQPIHASASSSDKSGSQLWAETCSRCHNFRPPQYYSDAQWDLIVHHMRLRANLTGGEARKITEFLQASN